MYICGAGPWPRGSVSRRRLSHCDGFWVIPKGAKVGRQPVGRVPLTSMQGASEWSLGSQGCERLEISLVRLWRTGSGIKPTGMLCRENRETERRGGELYTTHHGCVRKLHRGLTGRGARWYRGRDHGTPVCGFDTRIGKENCTY